MFLLSPGRVYQPPEKLAAGAVSMDTLGIRLGGMTCIVCVSCRVPGIRSTFAAKASTIANQSIVVRCVHETIFFMRYTGSAK